MQSGQFPDMGINIVVAITKGSDESTSIRGQPLKMCFKFVSSWLKDCLVQISAPTGALCREGQSRHMYLYFIFHFVCICIPFPVVFFFPTKIRSSCLASWEGLEYFGRLAGFCSKNVCMQKTSIIFHGCVCACVCVYVTTLWSVVVCWHASACFVASNLDCQQDFCHTDANVRSP